MWTGAHDVGEVVRYISLHHRVNMEKLCLVYGHLSDPTLLLFQYYAIFRNNYLSHMQQSWV